MGLLSLSDSALHNNGYEHFSVYRLLLSVKYVNTAFEILPVSQNLAVALCNNKREDGKYLK